MLIARVCAVHTMHTDVCVCVCQCCASVVIDLDAYQMRKFCSSFLQSAFSTQSIRATGDGWAYTHNWRFIFFFAPTLSLCDSLWLLDQSTMRITIYIKHLSWKSLEITLRMWRTSLVWPPSVIRTCFVSSTNFHSANEVNGTKPKHHYCAASCVRVVSCRVESCVQRCSGATDVLKTKKK